MGHSSGASAKERYFLQDMRLFQGYLESCARDWPACYSQGGRHFCNSGKGELFITLHLSQAYQQLLLDEESAMLFMMNTHLGLYHYYYHLSFPENDGSATKWVNKNEMLPEWHHLRREEHGRTSQRFVLSVRATAGQRFPPQKRQLSLQAVYGGVSGPCHQHNTPSEQ